MHSMSVKAPFNRDGTYAYTERVIPEQFIKSIIEIKIRFVKSIVSRGSLFTLHAEIEEDRAWYLESGYMESKQDQGHT